jgi:hypothetical protein
MAALREAVAADWVAVYGDREHFANLAFACGFDPRFEEALLLLGAGGERLLLVGLEGEGYASLLPVELDVVVCPSFSLMGQPRAGGPSLERALRDAGLAHGQRVGLVGWKSLEPGEWGLPVAALAAPSFLVDLLRHIAGAPDRVVDATPALTSPAGGLRARNSAAQLASFEWAATRASRAVRAIVAAAAPGISEREAVAAMGFEGDPLSAHVMFASGADVAVGLRSPVARRLERGDAATTAVGFWGGLSCRAGLIDDGPGSAGARDYLERMAIPYWDAIAHWHETLALGLPGGELHSAVLDRLDDADFRPALNPGHLIHLDEWVHSPIRPGSTEPLVSGMTLQCDIIPDRARPGYAANCEDTVALADADLRARLEAEHPSTWARITARRTFMREGLGIDVAEEVLPLSALPAWFAPFWLAPDLVLRRE